MTMKDKHVMKKFLEARLLVQIPIVLLVWAIAAFVFYIYAENGSQWLKTALWIIGLISLAHGILGFNNLKKQKESRMSEVDIIAKGVAKARSPFIYDLAEMISMISFGVFWFLVYLLLVCSSVILAPVMTLYVIVKIIKSKAVLKDKNEVENA